MAKNELQEITKKHIQNEVSLKYFYYPKMKLTLRMQF